MTLIGGLYLKTTHPTLFLVSPADVLLVLYFSISTLHSITFASPALALAYALTFLTFASGSNAFAYA